MGRGCVVQHVGRGSRCACGRWAWAGRTIGPCSHLGLKSEVGCPLSSAGVAGWVRGGAGVVGAHGEQAGAVHDEQSVVGMGLAQVGGGTIIGGVI